MAWKTPRTWVAGEVPTAAIMNAHVRDNLNALKNPPTKLTENWDTTITTTSTAFINITGAEVTITTTGGRLMIGFMTPHIASGGATTFFTITIDGVDVSAHYQGVSLVSGASWSQVSFVYLSAAQAAGAHTVQVRWRVNEGARTAQINKFQLWVREA